MTIKSYSRGHQIEYVNGDWIYSDNKERVSYERPCIQCNRLPTPEGYDPCLGYVKDAVNACCGHGVEEGFVDYGEGAVFRTHDINLFVHYPRLYATCSTLGISKEQVDEWVEKIKNDALCRGDGYDNLNMIQIGLKSTLVRLEKSSYQLNSQNIHRILGLIKEHLKALHYIFDGRHHDFGYLREIVGIRNVPILLAMLNKNVNFKGV